MTLLIDNYDSFSYNLYQFLGELDPDIRVLRNDEATIEEIRNLKPDCIVLSPGPGRPEQAGVIIDVVRTLGDTIPILGICLGHQAICAAYGGRIIHAQKPMHAKQSLVQFSRNCPIFSGLPDKSPVGRYHSLAVDPDTLPKELEVTARTDEGEIMAVKHTRYPIYGLQFHPESILTPNGKLILKNFMEEVNR